MAFLNPLLLFGIGAVSVPIVIHLLTKRKIKRVVWAAMQFLRPVVQRNQRRINLEDFILLALRCLLLVLLALALARPALRKAGAFFSGRGAETAVIAIDNSASMGATDGVSSRFEKAKKAAEQLIDALPAGSSAAVLFCSDIVRPAIPEPSFDLNLARKVIREGATSDRATDHQPTFSAALAILKRHAGSRKSIYLITDNQALGWKRLGDVRQMLDAAKLEVKTRIVIVGEPEDRNLAVSNLRLASALAPANQPVRFEVEVTNFGRDDASNVQMSLMIDGEPPCDEAGIESIPATTAKAVSLFARFREPGYHVLTAKIAGDHLPADDQRTIIVRALKEVNVLLVDGDPGAEPRESEVFFLEHALTPVPPSEKPNFFIKTATISPPELETTKLGDFDALVLANVTDCSDVVLSSIERYVRRGGGLIIFPGAKVSSDFYNGKMGKQFGLLPALLGPAHGKPEDQENFLTLQQKGYDHPIVQPWRDPAAGTLATAHFYRAFELKPIEAPDSSRRDETRRQDAGAPSGEPQVVVRYADGTPAVMERTFGFGRIIMFSSTVGTKWNDLPVRPVFVPLIHRTLGSILNREDERLNVRVGTTFELLCESEMIGKEAAITNPAKQEPSATARVASLNGLPILRYNETDLAGAYDVTLGTDTPLAIKFAAQPDAGESSVEELRQADVDSLAPAASATRWSAGVNFAETLEKERTGNEFWLAFAFCALAVACAETLLADRFSHAK